MKKKNKEKKAVANVEFGNEFGDLNASKIYDVLNISGKNNKGKKR